MQKAIKSITVAMAILCTALFSINGIFSVYLPSSYTISKSRYTEELPLAGVTLKTSEDSLPVSLANSNELSTKGQLMFGNIIPIKEVNINVTNDIMVVPGGTPFGVKLFTEGVMVVKIEEIKINNHTYTPAKDADIQIGDMILKADNKAITTNEELLSAIKNSNGNSVSILLNRNGQEINTILQPVNTDSNNDYRVGIWVRDSSAGIGTVTFYEPASGGFAGLGHGICDIDTGSIMPLSQGEVVNATIDSVTAAQKGKAGTLNGHHDGSSPCGYVTANRETGIYGFLNKSPTGFDAIPLAYKHEIKTGPAQIITTLDDNTTQYYDIEIESINYDDNSVTKNLVIKITDEDLLNKTNGIIQGMSGSPIIQENKLVGAITHVFVNEPNKGYGIFAENMLLDFAKENNNLQEPAA